MGVIVGIDVGGSTTKIVGFDENKKLIEPILVKANDPLTSVYGAFGKFTDTNCIGLSDINKITVTGVGSSFLSKPIYGLPCKHVAEFDSVGMGGIYISGLEKAIVVSMGTGTAIVMAEAGKEVQYLGGTGIGGGTITGIAKKLIGVSNVLDIVDLAKDGNLKNVDLRVSDMTSKNINGMASNDLTASNFGKLSDLASKSDMALGLLNMVFETVAMLSLFAARDKKIKNIVMTGNLTTIPQAKQILDYLSGIFGVNYIVPSYSSFATAIGAALSEFK